MHHTIKPALAELLIILLITLLASFALLPIMTIHMDHLHAVLEAGGVFITLSIFTIQWLTYQKNGFSDIQPYFGFLVIGIFLALHALVSNYGYPPAIHYQSSQFRLLADLTEGIVLVLLVHGIQIPVERQRGLVIFLVATIGISLPLLHYPDLVPLTVGIHPSPLFLGTGTLTFFLYLYSLYRWRNQYDRWEPRTHRGITLALLLLFPAELAQLAIPFHPIYFLISHLLFLFHYAYLFRSIFVGIVYRSIENWVIATHDMQEILNEMSVGIVTFDKHFRVTFANERTANILQCSSEELQGLTTEEFTQRFFYSQSAEDPLIRQIHSGAISGRNRIWTVNTGKGRKIKVKINGYRLKHGGFLLQMSEAKKEQELQELQLQTQTILNSVNSLLLVVDRRDRVILCNVTFEKTVEMSAEQIIGMPLQKLYKTLQFEKKELSSQNFAREDLLDMRESYEVTLRTPKGTICNLILYSAPITNVDGESIGSIIVASDITAMKKEHQLIQQQEKLALLGQMAAGLVHEIRNPLTIIKGFNQLILDRSSEKPIREYSRLICGAVDSMSDVVSDFLTFAKPHPPELKPLSINELLQSMKLLLQSMQLAPINFQLSDQEKLVIADESQLKQIIMNLVKNAMDATIGMPNPLLTIQTAYRETKNEMVISFRDNGRGMTPEALNRAGTPFFSTKEGGTGLGLSICYQIIKEHHGHIEVESAPDRGATFTLFLPCEASPEMNPSQATA